MHDKGGAKISWTTICLPKEEDGLSIKDPGEWHKAQILLHLLRIVSKATSQWTTWVNTTVLKNKFFWTMKIPTDCSWIWKKLLRSVALEFISCYVGNDCSISLRFDPWWRNSCLAFSRRSHIIRQCGLSSNATLYDLIASGEWSLPTTNARHRHLFFFLCVG